MRGNVVWLIILILFSIFSGKKRMPTYGDYMKTKEESERGRRMPNMNTRQHKEKPLVRKTQRVSTPMQPKRRHLADVEMPKKVLSNLDLGMERERDDFITREKRKSSQRGFFGRGGSREVDCDLDERIFGSRRQHKDIF